MNQAIIDVGDAVRITAGPYKGLEGVVEDRQLNCDTVRVSTNEGAAYCFIGDAVRLSEPTRSSHGKALLKKK
jgi:hypothetical protein